MPEGFSRISENMAVTLIIQTEKAVSLPLSSLTIEKKVLI